MVAATGNDGAIGPSAPANCNGVIGVTAHTINGENASYANIGAAMGVGPQPTISSPGGGSPTLLGAKPVPTDDSNWFGYYIWSTILFGNTSPSSGDSSSPPRSGPAYGGFTGTSAATPQVAAVAALIKSMIPNASPAAVRNYLVTTCAAASGGWCVHPWSARRLHGAVWAGITGRERCGTRCSAIGPACAFCATAECFGV